MSRETSQHYSGVNGFDADLGSVLFDGTSSVVVITTNLQKITGYSLQGGDVLTDESLTISSPSPDANGDITVVAGQVTIGRGTNTTSGARLYYNFVGI